MVNGLNFFKIALVNKNLCGIILQDSTNIFSIHKYVFVMEKCVMLRLQKLLINSTQIFHESLTHVAQLIH